MAGFSECLGFVDFCGCKMFTVYFSDENFTKSKRKEFYTVYGAYEFNK